MQPYLLAFCEKKEKGFTRSVLTAIARVGPNKTLFATCKHALTQMDRLFIVDENGVSLSEEKWAAIPVTKHDLDLVFLFIRHDVPAQRIRIKESPIARDTHLTHGRNRFGESETPSPFVTHSALARHSPFRAEVGFSEADGHILFRYLKEEGDFKDARREGVSTFYRVLEMASWKGVSGSALWDNFGAIRGMVCGGDSPEDRQEDGIPRLVYIPAKTILKEASLILKNPEFRARISQE